MTYYKNQTEMPHSKLISPKNLFDSTIPGTDINPGHIHLVGFPFDGTACFRKGTSLGPQKIREASENIETYSPYLDRDTTNTPIIDLGDLPIGKTGDVEKDWNHANHVFFELLKDHDIKNENFRILTMGGEHSISYAPIKYHLEKFPDLVLIHLDAHADLRDGYEGYHYSHASIIRRVLDHFGNEHELIQYGIRSGTCEEYKWIRENKTLIKDRTTFLQKISSIEERRPIYLTLDLDYFDPAFFPGTGTPEPGGEDFSSFVELLNILNKKYFVGADVVELSPNIDSTGNSSIFAAKIIRELLLTLA
ncbi:MAG: agmatinase [Bacteriovoracaceae bacterium]|nr:agmatinase [Bacteriovoracaceae bacterium]